MDRVETNLELEKAHLEVSPTIGMDPGLNWTLLEGSLFKRWGDAQASYAEVAPMAAEVPIHPCSPQRRH